MNIAASRTRAEDAAPEEKGSPRFSRGQAKSGTGVATRQRGTKMAAMDRSGFGFLPVNACELANARDQRAKTQAVPHATRPDRIVPTYRINSCGIPSRVETNISRRGFVGVRSSADRRYHYCSINPERRNSENCWSICGNLAPANARHFRSALIIKDLGSCQNGPPRASRVLPA